MKSEASFTSYVDLDVIPGQVIQPSSYKLILDEPFTSKLIIGKLSLVLQPSPDKPFAGKIIIGKLRPGTTAQPR